MWLTNSMVGVPISINYDWSDGSANRSDCEGNFGSVHVVAPAQAPKPKPAFTAASTLQATLGDFHRCTGRVATAAVSPATGSVAAADVFVVRFENGTGGGPPPGRPRAGVGFAIWTNGTRLQGQCRANGTSGAPHDQRVNCGFRGIGEAACRSPQNPMGSGCCWEPCCTPGACGVAIEGPQCYKIREALHTAITVTFDATPAVAGDCFSVTHMLGETGNNICVTAAGLLSAVILSNGTASGPIYLQLL